MPSFEHLLAELGNVRAQRFVEETSSPEELLKCGLARPTIQVELLFKEGGTRTLSLYDGTVCTAVVADGPIVELLSCRIVDELRRVF